MVDGLPRVRSRCTVGTAQLNISRYETDEILIWVRCFVYVLIAEPPGNVRSFRKITFGEFQWVQGVHGSGMLANCH